MLLDGSAGNDAHLAQLDGIVDLGPSQFFIAIFGFSSAGHHGSLSWTRCELFGRRITMATLGSQRSNCNDGWQSGGVAICAAVNI
jgi:hypothetical protein